MRPRIRIATLDIRTVNNIGILSHSYLSISIIAFLTGGQCVSLYELTMPGYEPKLSNLAMADMPALEVINSSDYRDISVSHSI